MEDKLTVITVGKPDLSLLNEAFYLCLLEEIEKLLNHGDKDE